MVLNIVISVICGLIGAYLFIPLSGWLVDKYSTFKALAPEPELPLFEYEVRLTRNSSHGIFAKTIYAGSDLAQAKTIYYEATGPARTTAELYTRGNHTASRKV